MKKIGFMFLSVSIFLMMGCASETMPTTNAGHNTVVEHRKPADVSEAQYSVIRKLRNGKLEQLRKAALKTAKFVSTKVKHEMTWEVKAYRIDKAASYSQTDTVDQIAKKTLGQDDIHTKQAQGNEIVAAIINATVNYAVYPNGVDDGLAGKNISSAQALMRAAAASVAQASDEEALVLSGSTKDTNQYNINTVGVWDVVNGEVLILSGQLTD